MSITQIIVRIAHITINMTLPTVNVEHLIMGVRQKYFEHNTTNRGCITHHYEQSNSNYKPMTANSASYRTNSR